MLVSLAGFRQAGLKINVRVSVWGGEGGGKCLSLEATLPNAFTDVFEKV